MLVGVQIVVQPLPVLADTADPIQATKAAPEKTDLNSITPFPRFYENLDKYFLLPKMPGESAIP
jgi:hypothetical protein